MDADERIIRSKQSLIIVHDTRHFLSRELTKRKKKRVDWTGYANNWNDKYSWQQAKRAKLYSDLLQVKKKAGIVYRSEFFTEGDHNFCIRGPPTWVYEWDFERSESRGTKAQHILLYLLYFCFLMKHILLPAHTHTHTPVSYTHLTLPTRRTV